MDTVRLRLHAESSRRLQPCSLDGLTLFSITTLDGYVCQSLPGHANASDELSRFFDFRVALVIKGPRRRAVDSTPSFPSLHEDTSVLFQDGYPVLLVSEESLEEVERRTWELARQGASDRVDPKWKQERVVMQRHADLVGSASTCVAERELDFDLTSSCAGPAASPKTIGSRCSSGRSCTSWISCQNAHAVRSVLSLLGAHHAEAAMLFKLPQVDPATGIPDIAIPTKVRVVWTSARVRRRLCRLWPHSAK